MSAPTAPSILRGKKRIAEDLLANCRDSQQFCFSAIFQAENSQREVDTSSAKQTWEELRSKEAELEDICNRIEDKMEQKKLDDATKEAEDELDVIEKAQEEHGLDDLSDEDD